MKTRKKRNRSILGTYDPTKVTLKTCGSSRSTNRSMDKTIQDVLEWVDTSVVSGTLTRVEADRMVRSLKSLWWHSKSEHPPTVEWVIEQNRESAKRWAQASSDVLWSTLESYIYQAKKSVRHFLLWHDDVHRKPADQKMTNVSRGSCLQCRDLKFCVTLRDHQGLNRMDICKQCLKAALRDIKVVDHQNKKERRLRDGR